MSNMKATVSSVATNVVALQVEVGVEQVAEALDRAFKKVVQQVSVPGFRKGKVPRAMFEKRFGVESLYNDAVDILLQDVYPAAVAETKIDPVDRPDIDVEQFAKGEPFKFTAKVTVKPEVTLGDYKKLVVPVESADVSDAEVSEELERLQQRHAELSVLTEGAAEDGDTTIIDFEGFVDGVPFEGGKGERHTLVLGSGSFIPGFEEQVVGLVIGSEKDIQVTFPAEYHSEALAGKDAVFKVKLHEIKRKVLPALDDEFAKDVSEFDTLAEYKADLTVKLRERKEKSNEQAREAKIVELVSEGASVEIPEAMISTEIDFMFRDFTNRLQQQGMNLELYSQFTGQDEAAIKEQMKEDAGKRVRNQLVLEAVAKAEGLEVTEQELSEELEKLSAHYGRSVEELRSIFAANNNLEGLKSDIELRKTVKHLVDTVNA